MCVYVYACVCVRVCVPINISNDTNAFIPKKEKDVSHGYDYYFY